MKNFSKRVITWLLAACMVCGLIGMTACATETSADTTIADDGCVVLDDGTCEDCTEEDDCGCCSTSADCLEDLN